MDIKTKTINYVNSMYFAQNLFFHNRFTKEMTNLFFKLNRPIAL